MGIKGSSPRVGRWFVTGATALMLGAGCADVADESESDDSLEVDGHEEALIDCKAAALTGAPTPNPSRSDVTLSASGVKNCTPEYLFQYAAPGSSTKVDIGTWSSSPSTLWTPPQSGVSGAFKVFVRVRAQGDSGAGNMTQNTVRIGDTCGITSFTASPNSPQDPGTSITVSAAASCTGVGATPQYRLKMYNGSTTTTLSGWSSTSSVNWNTTGLPVGNYTLYAEVRRAGNPGVDELVSMPFALSGTCSLSSVTTNPTPSAAGGTVSVFANGSCSEGYTGEYSFDYRLSSASAWTPIQGWGTDSAAAWDISGVADGDYIVRARARVQGTTATNAKTVAIHVGGQCQGVALSTSDTSPADSLTLQATPSCTSGTPEYLFQISPKVNPPVWNTLSDWSTSATASVAPGDYEAGDYKFRVRIRAQGTAPTFGSNTLAFSLLDPAPVGVGNILVWATGNDAEATVATVAGLQSSGAFESVTGNDNTTLSLETLLNYDAVLFYTNHDGDPANGDVLADYAETGRRLVLATFAWADQGTNTLGGRIISEEISPLLLQSESLYTYVSLGSYDAESAFFAGVSSIDGYYHDDVTLSTDAVLIGSWSDSEPLLARKANVVGLNLFPTDYYGDLSGDYNQLFVNALTAP